jgi:hypothetical protein
MSVMDEILPGVYHWTTDHPNIGKEVSSYWLDAEAVLIDPFVPRDGGIEWFHGRDTAPTAILLSCRHHLRDSERFAATFDCPILCNRAGLHEFEDRDLEVHGFDPGDELPGEVHAIEVGALSPDETALYLPAHRALLIADGVVRESPDEPLGFVPGQLMDDPEETRAGLLEAFEQLLDRLDFDHLLLAHGGPVLRDGREQLRLFVDEGGRTAFEL